MGGARSTHGRDKKCIHSFGQIKWREEHSEGLCVDRRIILEWILGKQCGKVWTVCMWLRIGTKD